MLFILDAASRYCPLIFHLPYHGCYRILFEVPSNKQLVYPSNSDNYWNSCLKIINQEGELQLDEHLSVEVLLTPGHDVSCISYKIENNLYTGDSYIPNCKLACHFPRSNRKQAKENEQRLKDLEAVGMKIMPGHMI